MSRWELEQVLRKRGVDDDQAAAELDRLESVGLLDDAALALTLVFTLHTRRGLGRRAIAHELAGRHIDPDIVMDALSEIEDDDERERALELAVKRLGQLSAYDDETIERRLSGFLARKGYGSGLVRDVVSAAMRARESPVRFS
jgi:regulatory protein